MTDGQTIAGVVVIFSCLILMIVLSFWSSRKINRLKKKLLSVEAKLEARKGNG